MYYEVKKLYCIGSFDTATEGYSESRTNATFPQVFKELFRLHNAAECNEQLFPKTLIQIRGIELLSYNERVAIESFIRVMSVPIGCKVETSRAECGVRVFNPPVKIGRLYVSAYYSHCKYAMRLKDEADDFGELLLICCDSKDDHVFHSQLTEDVRKTGTIVIDGDYDEDFVGGFF